MVQFFVHSLAAFFFESIHSKNFNICSILEKIFPVFSRYFLCILRFFSIFSDFCSVFLQKKKRFPLCPLLGYAFLEKNSRFAPTTGSNLIKKKMKKHEFFKNLKLHGAYHSFFEESYKNYWKTNFSKRVTLFFSILKSPF